VSATIGRFSQPFEKIPVGLLDGGKRYTPPKGFSDIVHRPFHLAFHPRAVGWTGHGLECVMIGKVGELHIEHRLAAFPADDHMLHVVIEHLHGNAAQIVKRMDVGVHEGLQGAAVDEHGKHGPGKSQDQDEQVNRKAAAM
jgi:hypothetical protein